MSLCGRRAGWAPTANGDENDPNALSKCSQSTTPVHSFECKYMTQSDKAFDSIPSLSKISTGGGNKTQLPSD